MEIGHLSDIKREVRDYTKNGKCSGCGGCCNRFLPMSQKEVNTIKQFVKRNNIKQQIHGCNILATPTIDLVCPFLSLDNKCSIYQVRPLICREFQCNKKMSINKFIGKCQYYEVDMVDVFFGTGNYIRKLGG